MSGAARSRARDVGIQAVHPTEVVVYAVDEAGSRWVRTFPRGVGGDILSVAAESWEAGGAEWKPPGPLRADPGTLDNIPGTRLYVGGESSIRCAALRQLGIRLLVSLQEPRRETLNEVEAWIRSDAHARHVLAPVVDVPAEAQTIESAHSARLGMLAARDALERGDAVAVHCLMGIHRSPAMCAALLVATGKAENGDEAFAGIVQARPISTHAEDTMQWFLRVLR